MASFISQLTEKAQELAQKSPLAGKIPGTTAPGAETSTTSTNQSAAGGRLGGSHTLGAIQHQLRQFGQQYSYVYTDQKSNRITHSISHL